jgi:hypothetical protein
VKYHEVMNLAKKNTVTWHYELHYGNT